MKCNICGKDEATNWHSNLQGLSLTAFSSILHGKRSGVCRNDGIKKEEQ